MSSRPYRLIGCSVVVSISGLYPAFLAVFITSIPLPSIGGRIVSGFLQCFFDIGSSSCFSSITHSLHSEQGSPTNEKAL